MTSYKVARQIEAYPETVWALLTEASGYAQWNPAVVGIEGTIAVDETIQLRSIVAPKRVFKLRVAEMDAPRKMVWSDGMPFGLFKGVRTYTLEPSAAGTSFAMEEVFTGLMEPLIKKSMPDLTDSFNQFADGLKLAAEASRA